MPHISPLQANKEGNVLLEWMGTYTHEPQTAAFSPEPLTVKLTDAEMGMDVSGMKVTRHNFLVFRTLSS